VKGFWKNSLRGLILTGGKSLRMKTDKSLLNYHGKSQIEYCADLLLPLCEEVFLSFRPEQKVFYNSINLSKIFDVVSGIGPLGGILSALTRYPDSAWLVLACDLPFVDRNVLENLIVRREPLKIATSYRNANGLPEPMCAIYEPHCIAHLLKFLMIGEHCPRKILAHSNIRLIDMPSERCLANVNTPEEYSQAIQLLKQ